MPLALQQLLTLNFSSPTIIFLTTVTDSVYHYIGITSLCFLNPSKTVTLMMNDE